MAQFKIKKLKLQTDRVQIGTDSGCAVRLVDPIAAPVHCSIEVQDGSRLDSGGVVVKDEGSATGTYVDGRPVPEGGAGLSASSVIVVGISRVEVKIADGVVSLTPRDKGFTYKKAGDKDGVMQPSDRDRWGLTEKGMGRLRSVWAGNRLAVLLIPLIALGTPLYWEWLSDPGPLTDPHRALYEGLDVAHASDADCSRTTCRSDRMIEAAKIAADQGCEACHDPWGGTPTAKCYQCHEDLMQNQHPFPVLHEEGKVGGNVSASFDDQQCVLCHVEHRPSGTFLPALADERMRDKTVALCSECHGDLFPADAPGKPYEIAAERESAPPELSLERAYSPVYFPHSLHIGLEPMSMQECSWCHTPVADAIRPDAAEGDEMARYLAHAADPSRLDFEDVVPYERCEVCHDADAELGDAPSDLREWIEARRSANDDLAQKMLWAVDWHGTDQPAAGDEPGGFGNCTTCHLEEDGRIAFPDVDRPRGAITGDLAAALPLLNARNQALNLKTVERPTFGDYDRYVANRARYQYTKKLRRTHSHEFSQDASGELRVEGKRCTECHVDGEALAAEVQRPVTFWHALHLSADPGELGALGGGMAGEELVATINQQCEECHSDRRGSSGLSEQPFTWVNEQACAQCHREGAAGEGAAPWIEMTAVAPDAAAAAMTMADFPHDQHMDVEGGCLECHSFEAAPGGDPNDAYRMLVRTKAEAMDCASCHGRHQNIGGAACDKCHRQPTEGDRSRFNLFWGKAPADALEPFGPLARDESDPDSTARPYRRWPRLNAFSHFSIGHAEVTDGEPSFEEGCQVCHVEGSWVEGETTRTGSFSEAERAAGETGDVLAFLPIPTEHEKTKRDNSCRECHLNLETHRFHWR